MSAWVDDARDFISSIARFALAIAAGVLPRHYWPRLAGHVPIWSAAVVSGLATLAVGAAIGISGFIAYAEGYGDSAAETMLRATGWLPQRASAPVTDAQASAMWLSAPTALFSYAFFTPDGLAALYLALTGFLRAAAVAAGDPQGDPVLTIVDSAGRGVIGAVRRHVVREARERREGPEVPDRLLTGAAAGFLDADFVVVASRPKVDWTPGTFVITPEAWYRLGTPVERETPAGLRTLYPLKALNDLEVLRRGVAYELPPLQQGSADAGPSVRGGRL